MIIFTFDDHNRSNEKAAKRLYEMGVQGIFLLNDHPKLKEEIEMLKKYNQIIGNHTRSHRNMNRFTEEDFKYEVLDFQKELERYGEVSWFSYPYSQRPNQEIMNKLKDAFPNILRGVEGFDERLKDGLEDWHFWLKALSAGYTVTTIQKPLFNYRRHGKTMVSGVNQEMIIRVLKLFYENM